MPFPTHLECNSPISTTFIMVKNVSNVVEKHGTNFTRGTLSPEVLTNFEIIKQKEFLPCHCITRNRLTSFSKVAAITGPCTHFSEVLSVVL
jgi:hypothetical protein